MLQTKTGASRRTNFGLRPPPDATGHREMSFLLVPQSLAGAHRSSRETVVKTFRGERDWERRGPDRERSGINGDTRSYADGRANGQAQKHRRRDGELTRTDRRRTTEESTDG